MLTVTMAAGIILFSLVLSTAMLWLSARITFAGHPTFKRAFACTFLLMVIALPVSLAEAVLRPDTIANQLVLAGLQFLVVLVSTWFVVARVFHVTLPRAMLVSIPYFALCVAAGLGLIYFNTYCMEAFIIPTNSMAPTFFGWHHAGVCPHCQGKVIITGRPPHAPDFAPRFAGEIRNGICTQCRKISEFKDWPNDLQTPVRIWCNKIIQLQRGDALIFIYPRAIDLEPKTMYVQRLIGLPGEKVEIKEEAVWINGEKWTPPPELSGLVHTSWAGAALDDERAKEPRSWDLGPDDFFVLGDFTTNSSDSRDWGMVPRANLVGVATVIYWPPSAWRILR